MLGWLKNYSTISRLAEKKYSDHISWRAKSTQTHVSTLAFTLSISLSLFPLPSSFTKYCIIITFVLLSMSISQHGIGEEWFMNRIQWRKEWRKHVTFVLIIYHPSTHDQSITSYSLIAENNYKKRTNQISTTHLRGEYGRKIQSWEKGRKYRLVIGDASWSYNNASRSIMMVDIECLDWRGTW